MSLSAWLHFLRWWHAQLVTALLYPAFWRAVALGESAQRRFDRLVYYLDCWPLGVRWQWSGVIGIQIYDADLSDVFADMDDCSP